MWFFLAGLLGCEAPSSDATAPETPVRPERPERPPNILIVLWDTTRADRLTLQGYGRPTTPRLAKWAEGGVVFEHAISPAMWTVPSHASMFTGLPPSTHGADTEWRWLDNHHLTLAEWLSEQGYGTYAFSANPNLSPTRVNLVQGFGTVHTSWGAQFRRQVVANANRKLLRNDRSTEISPAYERTTLTHRPFTYNAAPVTEEAFLGWLESRADPDAPWFAYLSFMEPHKPRIPDIAARRRLASSKEIDVQLATDVSFRNQLAYSYDRLDYAMDELQAIGQVYDATLVELDQHTGALLDALEAGGHLDDTLVVFTSDHGELLGEHGLFGHRHSVYQELVHVPLVLSWPGHLAPRRVTRPVSNLDLFNTVLEVAGLPKPDTGFSRGNLLDDDSPPAAFTEMATVDVEGWKLARQQFPDLVAEGHPRLRTHRAFVKGAWKVIRDSAGVSELYDLSRDSGEKQNLAKARPDELREMLDALEAWEKRMAPYDPGKRTAADAEPVDDAETRAQLEMLGYVDQEG